jgi:hypothetical protein
MQRAVPPRMSEYPAPFRGGTDVESTSPRQPPPFAAIFGGEPVVRTRAVAQGLRPSDPMDWAPRDLDKLIADPKQALDVFDFEPVMRKNVPPARAPSVKDIMPAMVRRV